MAAMRNAIRKAGVHLVTAEMEVGFTGVTKWPFADALVQIEQTRFARDFRTWLGGHEATRRRWRCGWGLIARPLT
jgi:hypothetical protein